VPLSSVYVEGDYIETVEGLLFAVKGVHHPTDRVIAYLRYVPDPSGERERGEKRYKRVYDIDETTHFLRENYSHYLSEVDFLDKFLQTVPVKKISRLYEPRAAMQSIFKAPKTRLEQVMKSFISAIIAGSNVSLTSFGISGSMLIGLVAEGSDIDLIVYGERNGLRTYNALKILREKKEIKPYDAESVKKVAKSRWGDTGIDLSNFMDIEMKKFLHGIYNDTEYFIRLVKTRNERREVSRPIQLVRGRAVISDDRLSIFTPCRYRVDKVTVIDPKIDYAVSELISYRGKFTEQAKKGDFIEFRGTLEEVEQANQKYFRIVLGGTGDYLVPVKLIDR
jgi:predicted nucleotidyltransferase